MYIVSQITPLEWRKAAVCNHDDDAINDNEFHLCKNSLNSLDGHEDFMSAAEVDGGGNCSENYSTLEGYLSNASEELSKESVAWMSIEHRRNFLEQQQPHHQHREFGSAKRASDDNDVDIDDDGLIGFEKARRSSFASFGTDELDESQNIELISYENNFNLKNSFWWAMGTLIQAASDVNPKVSPLSIKNFQLECRWLRGVVRLPLYRSQHFLSRSAPQPTPLINF